MADHAFAHDVAIEAVKVAPPSVVAGGLWMGVIDPAALVTYLTILYLLASIGLLIPKYWRQMMDWRDAWKARRESRKNDH